MNLIGGLKDKVVLFCWIAGLLLLTSLIWALTQPIQTYYLLRTVNSVFISADDPRRLSAYMPDKSKNTNILGHWYSMHNSTNFMFVFTVFQDGILVPLGAIVSADGDVQEVIPLSAHAEQVFSNLPRSVLQIYIRRIENLQFFSEGDKK